MGLENKVRVTALFGGSQHLGVIDPQIGMTTQYGDISGLDSGNYQVTVMVGTGNTPQKFYPHDLFITQLEATGTWSYPTGDGAIPYTHSQGILASGPPNAIGSGTAFQTGQTVFTFGR